MTIHKVLLVEDDDLDASRVLECLNAHDMQITWVHTGEEAFQLLKNQADNKFSVVLIDINLPGIDGMKFTDYLRHDETLYQLPVIMITKSKMPFVETTSYDVGANYFLIKPIDIDEMDKAIRHMHLIGSICPT